MYVKGYINEEADVPAFQALVANDSQAGTVMAAAISTHATLVYWEIVEDPDENGTGFALYEGKENEHDSSATA